MIRQAYNASWFHPIDLAERWRAPMPAASSIEVVCTVAISRWLKVLRTISSPLESGHSEMTVPRLSRRVGHGLIVPSNSYRSW